MSNLTDKCGLKDCKELKQMILDNPEAPLLLLVGEDAWDGDYCYNSCTPRVRIDNLTLHNDRWMDEEELQDKLADDLYEVYSDLSDDEFEDMIDKHIRETEFVKVIVVTVG